MKSTKARVVIIIIIISPRMEGEKHKQSRNVWKMQFWVHLFSMFIICSWFWLRLNVTRALCAVLKQGSISPQPTKKEWFGESRRRWDVYYTRLCVSCLVCNHSEIKRTYAASFWLQIHNIWGDEPVVRFSLTRSFSSGSLLNSSHKRPPAPV